MSKEEKKDQKPLTPEMMALRNKEREKVRGKFIFHEVPGGHIEFPFRKFKGDQIEIYKFTDGEIYTIPLGVARHLNNNCSYPSYTFKQDAQGRPQMGICEQIRRTSFQSLEFVDIDDVPTVLPKVS